jgi:hypothetical protein
VRGKGTKLGEGIRDFYTDLWFDLGFLCLGFLCSGLFCSGKVCGAHSTITCYTKHCITKKSYCASVFDQVFWPYKQILDLPEKTCRGQTL